MTTTPGPRSRPAPRDPRRALARDGRGARGPRRFVIEAAYGDVYSRPGLSLRDRQIATVAVLVALGRSSQLPVHLRSSLKAGLSAEELREIILQTAVLAGFPQAMNAWSTLRTVLAEPREDDP